MESLLLITIFDFTAIYDLIFIHNSVITPTKSCFPGRYVSGISPFSIYNKLFIYMQNHSRNYLINYFRIQFIICYIVQKVNGFAPITKMSFAAALNKSIPIVSYLYHFLAMVFVPTRQCFEPLLVLYIQRMIFKLYREPNEPIPVRTFSENVELTLFFILLTASLPASISTPADL